MSAMAKASGTASASLAAFDWLDPFHLAEQFDEEERMIQQAAHDYCQSRLLPPGACRGSGPPHGRDGIAPESRT